MVSQTATVLGKVTAPGVVPLDREMTVSTVLGRVGGALPTGAGYVVIQHKDGTQQQVVIDDLIKGGRSEEHTSELQSLMRISYAVFCLKKTKKKRKHQHI